MRFSIILSIDCDSETNIGTLRPTTRSLYKTEGDEQYEFEYLGGTWVKGHHRKWCGVLTKKTFEKILFQYGLSMQMTETLGMIGSPHGQFSAPAISFTVENGDEIIDAYVCPLPNKKEQRKFPPTEEGWKKIKDWLYERYEYYVPGRFD